MTALCPDTLREVLSAVEQYSERVAGRTTSRRAAQRGVIAACKDIAATLRTALDAAASEPPRLSAWLAACEGTGLGPWTARTGPVDVVSTGATVGGAPERLHQEGDNFQWRIGDLRVYVSIGLNGASIDARRVGPLRSVLDVRCSTPAELRAALERLAQEAQR